MKTKKHLIILLAFFSIVFISCLSSSRAEGNTINHTVKRGETLYSLARKYNY
jgi:CBS domain containing-hemolysin-like protein